jgi:hypothetical protein
VLVGVLVCFSEGWGAGYREKELFGGSITVKVSNALQVLGGRNHLRGQQDTIGITWQSVAEQFHCGIFL